MQKKSLFVFLILLVQTAYSQTDSVKLVQFSTGYKFPLGIENCGDTRLFVVQKTGQIVICDSSGKRFTTPFLDIKGRVNSTADEAGLLGLAFDPHYASSGEFYIYYINNAGNAQISQFKVSSTNPNLADSNSEKKVLDIPLPTVSHVGGCLRFGPDGYLYLGIGDGNNSSLVGDPANNAQNTSLLSGKMLRIQPHFNGTYSVPKSNPFRHVPNYRKEIWALGLRNPWRFSFDAFTGNLYIADAGEAKREEVNVQAAASKGGENYGWRCYEGDTVYNTTNCAGKDAYTFPAYVYGHNGSPVADCVIIGGFVYRGSKYPSMWGKYFFTDFCSGVLRSLSFNGNTVTKKDEWNSGYYYVLTSFGEDANHELYAVSLGGKTIYKVVSTSGH